MNCRNQLLIIVALGSPLVRRMLSARLPNWLGIRSLYHQVRRGFREAEKFEVRYWSL